MDELIRYNRERWEALSSAGVSFGRPWMDLDPVSARQRIDPEGQLQQLSARRVLCLAAGGGQQSAAFALLGSLVTVLDFSPNQLDQDRKTAAHYGLPVETIEGDMRDLSRFADGSFDIVWLAHSINFIPDVRSLIDQMGRICAADGMLRMSFTNPYVHGAWDRFRETGYLVEQPFVEGAEVLYEDRKWDIKDESGKEVRVTGPREFRHTLPTIINGLIQNQFEVRGFWEETGPAGDARPGSWEHFQSVAPPWITIWARHNVG